MTSKTVEERFWSKVDKTDTCWNWTAGKNTGGYGHFWLKGKDAVASRVSWELLNGPIINNLCVLHKCDNKTCVNPDHLFLGTNKENTEDMFKKGRQPKNTGAKGEAHYDAKLTKEQVLEIRDLYSKGNTTHRKLSKQFGVNPSQIGKIIRKIYWKHI